MALQLSLVLCLLVTAGFRPLDQQKPPQAPAMQSPGTRGVQVPRPPVPPRRPEQPGGTVMAQAFGDSARGQGGGGGTQLDPPAPAVFAGLRQSLVSGDISGLSTLLAPQVSVSLKTGEHGYFSSNQAFLLIQHFLRTRKIVSLNFSTLGGDGNVPFATGSAIFLYRGNRHVAQVYVSLSRRGNRWMISQLNIY